MKCPIEDILLQAGELMMSYARPKVEEKAGHANFVTEADVAVQALLVRLLSQRYPEAAFMAEEEETHRLGQQLTFIIDPIDGTTNYMRRRRDCGISVGAVENGKAVLAGVYLPYKQELYCAAPGQGAWCNGERLHVSDFPAEKGLVMLGTSPYNQEYVELTARCTAALLRGCGDLRRSGAAVVDLCDVAAGRAEAMFEWVSHPWDYCASSLIVEEAGGRVGSILTDTIGFEHQGPILAAAPQAYDHVRRILLEAWEAEKDLTMCGT